MVPEPGPPANSQAVEGASLQHLDACEGQYGSLGGGWGFRLWVYVPGNGKDPCDMLTTLFGGQVGSGASHHQTMMWAQRASHTTARSRSVRALCLSGRACGLFWGSCTHGNSDKRHSAPTPPVAGPEARPRPPSRAETRPLWLPEVSVPGLLPGSH